MYLRRNGWADSDTFSLTTAAGEVRPRITGPDTCTVDMGRAKLASSKDFPSGGADGTGTLTAAGRELSFQFVSVGNPQCSIEIEDGLEELDLPALGGPIESHELFPNRTNVSFWQREGDSAIRARIFERGVGETMSSGTGATGAAVAAVVRGLDSPVTVRLDGGELEVDVAEDLHIDLTGWARPVYAGELSDEFVKELKSL
jgi:diaminopimelate epimerase